MSLNNHRPRQLGSLHDRMSYVMALLRNNPELANDNSELWHALFDLETLVENLPDVAFHETTNEIVPARDPLAKRGREVPYE